MREKIEAFKKLWAIPRYKAIIQLILWISFFFILYLVMCTIAIFNKPVQNNSNIVVKTALENYQEMSNYEYIYEYNYILNNENKSLTINGTKYNDQNTFKLLGTKYSIIDNTILDVNNNTVTNLTDYDITLLLPNNIVALLETAINKEVTKYSDGKAKTEYEFDDMLITTYDNNQYITEIELDLTKYMQKTNSKITYYTIKITYENINNIDSLS